MKLAVCAIGLAAFVAPSAAAAQQADAPAPSSDERRLTPEQVEAVLAEAAARRAAEAGQLPPELPTIDRADPLPPPQIHGEVGFSVGTGGYREVFGTGIYPLGDDGTAIISLDWVNLGRPRTPNH